MGKIMASMSADYAANVTKIMKEQAPIVFHDFVLDEETMTSRRTDPEIRD